jgi:hypothetical protein
LKQRLKSVFISFRFFPFLIESTAYAIGGAFYNHPAFVAHRLHNRRHGALGMRSKGEFGQM